MKITESIDLLRGRFVRLKKGRPFMLLSGEIGLDHTVLARFARGESMKTSQLQIIEVWCNREEKSNGSRI